MNALEQLYGENIPAYVLGAGKAWIKIKVGSWEGKETSRIKITIADVVTYYATQANNIVSGCRTLAGYTSDWRGIDYLAKECLEYFKLSDIITLRKVSKKAGLTPKF